MCVDVIGLTFLSMDGSITPTMPRWKGTLGTTIFIHCGSCPAHVAARLFEKLATQCAQNRKLGGLGKRLVSLYTLSRRVIIEASESHGLPVSGLICASCSGHSTGYLCPG